MTGRTLTWSALAALAQAKAIITNNCPHEVYVWSVPRVGSSHTDNLPIKSGGRYEEPWRYGTAANPGIAIKLSPQADGINKGGDEIDFAYSIDQHDKSKIWVDLSPVRGKAFDNKLSFHTCHGTFRTSDLPTSQCHATDDVELVLCESWRTTPPKDITPFEKIQECYDYHHVYHESTHEYPQHVPLYHHDSAKPSKSVAEQSYLPHSSMESYTAPPKPCPTMSYMPSPQAPHSISIAYGPSLEHSTPPPYGHTTQGYVIPLKSAQGHYTPPRPTTETSRVPPKHTSEEYGFPAKPTYGHHAPAPAPEHTTEHGHTVNYHLPQPTSSEHYTPPKHTPEEYGTPAKPTYGHHAPAPAPEHTIEHEHTVNYHLPQPTSNDYNAPPKNMHEHFPSFNSTSEHSRPSKIESNAHYSPLKPSSKDHYMLPQPTPDHSDYLPFTHTQGEPYHVVPRPTEHPPPMYTWGEPQYPAPSHSSVEKYQGPARQTFDRTYGVAAKPTYEEHQYAYSRPTEHVSAPSYFLPHQPTPKWPASYLSPLKPTPNRPHLPQDTTTDQPYPPPSKILEARDTACQKNSDCSKIAAQSHCMAKVVYPMRRAILLKDRNNSSIPTTRQGTVPLSVVVRHEAAKYQSVPKPVERGSLCDVLRKYLPEVTDCDEGAVKLQAQEIYAQLCEPRFAVPGIDCKQIQQEIKKLYPDVDHIVTIQGANASSNKTEH